MEKYLTKEKMHGKQSQWIFQLCQLEIRSSSYTKKKKKDGKNRCLLLFLLSTNFKSKSQCNGLWDKDTWGMMSSCGWLITLNTYSLYILYIVMFVCLSIRGNWLHLFFNIEHKMKLPIKFQIPRKSEGSPFGSNLELIVHIC